VHGTTPSLAPVPNEPAKFGVIVTQVMPLRGSPMPRFARFAVFRKHIFVTDVPVE